MTDWAEKNRSHFDEQASTYNSKFRNSIEQITRAIQERLDFIGVDWIDPSSSSSEDEAAASSSKAASPKEKSIRLLDYACGTGMISRALAPYITQSIGIDISSSMVEEYNSSASNQGLSASEMRAFVGDLLSPIPSPSLSPPEFHDFDIAAVGLGFHHFTDPRLAALRLAERLKKGGVLFIVDFLPHEHVHGHAAHTVVHMGFEEKDIRTWFEEAGVGAGFRYEVLGKGMVVMHDGREQKRSLFMARGTKM